MEKFFWRTWARAVAHVDLVFSIVAVMSVITLTVVLGFAAATAKVEIITDSHGHVIGKTELFVPWTAFIVPVLLALIAGLKLWASVKLLWATQFGKDVNEVLEKIRFWGIMNFLFLFLDVVFVCAVTAFSAIGGRMEYPLVLLLFTGAIGGILISFIFLRGSFLFIVYKFMEELAITSDSGGLEGVGAGHVYPDGTSVK